MIKISCQLIILLTSLRKVAQGSFFVDLLGELSGQGQTIVLQIDISLEDELIGQLQLLHQLKSAQLEKSVKIIHCRGNASESEINGVIKQLEGHIIVLFCPFSLAYEALKLELTRNELLLRNQLWLLELDEERLFDLPLRLDSNLYAYNGVTFDLFEVYKVKAGILNVSRKIGTWTPQLGLDLPTPDAYKRRSNLSGLVLDTVQMPWPLQNQIQRSPDDPLDISDSAGLFPDIADTLAGILGFGYTERLPPDLAWGAFDPETGRWNGMVRVLMRKEADMILAGLSTFLERGEVIDYSKVIFEDTLTLNIMKPEGRIINFGAYILIFTQKAEMDTGWGNAHIQGGWANAHVQLLRVLP